VIYQPVAYYEFSHYAHLLHTSA